MLLENRNYEVASCLADQDPEFCKVVDVALRPPLPVNHRPPNGMMPDNSYQLLEWLKKGGFLTPANVLALRSNLGLAFSFYHEDPGQKPTLASLD